MFFTDKKEVKELNNTINELLREKHLLEEKIRQLELRIPSDEELCFSELCKFCEHNKNKGKEWFNVVCDLRKYNCKQFK